jgi:hypothetical protein
MSDIRYPYLDFPNIIDITLYKHNYYDNLLVNKIKRDAEYGDLPELKDCYIVLAEEFQDIFYKTFTSEIDKVKSLPVTDLQKNATSLYFMDKIFSTFTNLKFVKVNVSKETSYSRINKSEKVPTIFFNYKIAASTINLANIFDTDLLGSINQFLIEMGLVKEDSITGYSHIIDIKAQDFLSILNENSENIVAEYLFNLIDPKTELDDPSITLVTDFDI